MPQDDVLTPEQKALWLAEVPQDDTTTTTPEKPKTGLQKTWADIMDVINHMPMGSTPVGPKDFGTQLAERDPNNPPIPGQQNALWGVGGAAAGALTGGLPGALIGGGLTGASPPKTPGDVASTAASFVPFFGPLKKAEQAAQSAGPLAKAAFRGGTGLLGTLENYAIKKAFGENADATATKTAIGTALPILLGSGMDALGQKIKANNLISSWLQRLSGSKEAQAVTPENVANVTQNVSRRTNVPIQELQQQIGNYVSSDVQAAQAKLVQLRKESENIAAQQLALKDSVPGEKYAYNAALSVLNKKQAAIKSQIEEIRSKAITAQKLGIQSTALDPKTGEYVNAGNKSMLEMDMDDEKRIEQLKNYIEYTKQGRSVQDPSRTVSQSPSAQQEDINRYKQQIQSIQDAQKQRSLTAWQKQQELQAQHDNLDSPTNPVPVLNAKGTFLKTAQERLKNDIKNITDEINDPKHKFDMDPQLRSIFDPTNGENQVRANIVSADSDTLKKMLDHFGSGPEGDKKRQLIQDIYVNDLFKKAYDPASKTWSKLDSLRGNDGPFSPDKMITLFGGGVDGVEKLKAFNELLPALQKVTERKDAGSLAGAVGKISLAGLGAAIASPVAAALHIHPGYLIAGSAIAGASAAGKYAQVKMDKFITDMLAQPKLRQQFTKWVSNGASQQGLQMTPALMRYLDSQPSISGTAQ